MDAFALTLAIAAIVLAIFAAIIHSLLRLHVSRERLLEVEDLGSLWRYCPPPRLVLSDKGKRFHTYLWVSAAVSLTIFGLLILLVTARVI